MRSTSYKFIVEEMEKHYNRKFGEGSTRTKLLNAAFEKIRGCSEASIMNAADSLMLKSSYLPSLDVLMNETLAQNNAEAKVADDKQERRATERKYGKDVDGPLPPVIKQMFDGLANGTTRNDWHAHLLQLDNENGTTYAAEYLEYLGRLSKIKDVPMDGQITPAWA